MTEGPNVLDWLFAAGQGLVVASLFYFLYLVVRYWRCAHFENPDTARHSARGTGSTESPRTLPGDPGGDASGPGWREVGTGDPGDGEAREEEVS